MNCLYGCTTAHNVALGCINACAHLVTYIFSASTLGIYDDQCLLLYVDQ